MLQPLDVCVNKLFKDSVCRLYTDWMAQRRHALKTVSKIKRRSIELVRSWILDAWRSLPADLIAISFRKTRIANTLDGSARN